MCVVLSMLSACPVVSGPNRSKLQDMLANLRDSEDTSPLQPPPSWSSLCLSACYQATALSKGVNKSVLCSGPHEWAKQPCGTGERGVAMVDC